jgi:protein required for attachment to host cells
MNIRNNALGTDRPGRSLASTGAARSALGDTDFARQGEDRFAAEAAAVKARLAGEMDKDLTGHSVEDMAAILSR